MAKERTVTGTITRMDRMNSSVNGNPRWLVTLDNGQSYRTAPDAMVSYGLNNPEYQRGPVTFTLNGRDHITNAEPANN